MYDGISHLPLITTKTLHYWILLHIYTQPTHNYDVKHFAAGCSATCMAACQLAGWLTVLDSNDHMITFALTIYTSLSHDHINALTYQQL